jgi:hypothetical protein
MFPYLLGKIHNLITDSLLQMDKEGGIPGADDRR